MNKRPAIVLAAIVGLLLGISAGWGQFTRVTPDPEAPRPPRPLLRKIPENTAWTVSARLPHEVRRARLSEEQAKALFPDRAPDTQQHWSGTEIKRADHAYSSGVRFYTIEYQNGGKISVYLVDGYVLHEDATTGQIHVLPSRDPIVSTIVVKPNELDEFAWLAERFYIGTASYAGRPCHVYRQYQGAPPPVPVLQPGMPGPLVVDPSQIPEPVADLSELQPGASPKILRTAFVDVETLLPLALEHADGVWTYEFRPLEQPLAMPERFRQALLEYYRTAQRLEEKYAIPQ